uniref:Uncharacterized protein n=1 Tax=Photinus pyralis TaxID=7054 RepID=A0A1Y1MTX7_PHOPY
MWQITRHPGNAMRPRNSKGAVNARSKISVLECSDGRTIQTPDDPFNIWSEDTDEPSRSAQTPTKVSQVGLRKTIPPPDRNKRARNCSSALPGRPKLRTKGIFMKRDR